MGMEVAESGFLRPGGASHDSAAAATNGAVRFSISKRKSQRGPIANAADREQHSVEFVSSVDEIGIQVVGEPSSSSKIKVIPPLEDSWKPEKRMKNLIMAPEDSVQEFVGEVLPAGPVEGVQYGLSVRSSASGNVKMDIVQARELRSKMDKQALEEHLEFLPESASLEAYESMPVEKFGEALLMGLGWRDGGGIGRRATKDVKATEYVRRPERLGLGATPVPKKDERERKIIKPGESREAKPDLVAPLGPDGKIRHRVEIGEKLVERAKKGVYGGKVMSIIAGIHAGLRGDVLGRKDKLANPGDVVRVKLASSGETVEIDAKNLADVGSIEEENAMKRLKDLRIAKGETSTSESGSDRPWLTSQIRVRIVSKKFQGGKLYLKKGRVLDVVAPTVCDLVLDDSGDIVQGVKQDYLETAIPKPGGRVVVVGGKFKGSLGKLLERDNKNQVAVIQMEESFEMATLHLDHLAEFTGDGA